ncbi:alpha/beta hydrolase fold domain-containing protein [Allorhizobium taibaishanense]|uniref:Esterase n=1 Tax=Allorhizobium taibaishanense TaxID=887144 RepID=A0A1Q9A6X4_9HYPH|nr:alpha/beta hydrolase [Allorhizobium taibaishanense]MBB4008512.1 acetyl esterase/lipase [Allorhizobium taibaishanense]OLP50329.1 esterase [Allorhizobium taibaishanense]
MSVQVKDMVLDKLAVGPVPARVYQGAEYAKGPPVVLLFHGGAFAQTGLIDSQVADCLAGTGAIVVVPDYNAPLGPVFPSPLEVGFAIFSYLSRKRAGLGDRKSLLLVAGEEAGGNIAAGIALKARDYHANELDGQVLLSPLLDPFMGTGSIREAEGIGMERRWSEGWSQYLSGGKCHPYAAPRLCSRLAGVAPALVVSAQDDPLRDEGLGFAQSLQEAGVHVCRHVLPPGLGWSSIYGGDPGAPPTWQQELALQFAAFVKHIGSRPEVAKPD